MASVTDFAQLKEERRDWSDFSTVSAYIGSGPHIREGSPAHNAASIKAPVLLFHGTLDRNVRYAESTLMQSKLRAANRQVELVTFEGLDHQLEDSAARTTLLQRSDEFFTSAFAK